MMKLSPRTCQHLQNSCLILCIASLAICSGIPAVAMSTLPPPVTVLTPVLSRLFPVASISLVPPLTRASPVLKAVPVSWMALEGMLVIMFTPSVATVLRPEVPAEKTVWGAETMFWGTALTNPVPGQGGSQWQSVAVRSELRSYRS